MSMRMMGQLGKADRYSRSVPIIASTPQPVDGEAITAWDLGRFMKSPVILWAHDNTQIPIGLASDIEWDPEVGLKMMANFTSEKVNPLAEQIFQGVYEGVIRAVSVGYNPADVDVADDAGNITKKRAAKLLEVSFVPVGADEDAGTPALNPEAEEAGEDEEEEAPGSEPGEMMHKPRKLTAKQRREKIAEAARALAQASHRARKAALRAAKKASKGKGPVASEGAPAPAGGGAAMVRSDRKDIRAMKKAARKQVELQLRRGEIKPKPCAVCKGTPTEAHHDDYSKPTKIRWLCKECHEKHHHETHTDACDDFGEESDRFDMQDGEVLRIDRSTRLGKVQRTQVGGARVPARLSRTGVLVYRNPDGSQRRELRLPEEVFNADSLSTLEHAPVIDYKDHTGLVSPDTWRKVSLGHVAGVRQDGKYIESDLIIQDADTLDAIERGDRSEISCGYVCRLDFTPGEYEGERYDCIQRGIRYNHAALCPPNGGRAGPSVGLRLDNQNAPSWSMSLDSDEGEKDMKLIRLDGKDYEFGSQAHIDKLESMAKEAEDRIKLDHKSAIDKLVSEHNAALEAAKKETDKLQGRLDGVTSEFETFKADSAKTLKKAEEEKAEREKSVSARILRRVKLMRMALRFFDDDKEMDEEKMDGMSDREIMEAVIRKRSPNFDMKDRTDDYVESRFDSIMESAREDRGVNGVVNAARHHAANLPGGTSMGRFDAKDSPVVKARADREAAYRDAWKNGGAPVTGASQNGGK